MLEDKKEKQKGTSILFAVLVLSLVLSVSFGIANILMFQIKILKEVGHSVAAFYAADAGIEKVLMERHSPQNLEENLSNGASFRVIVTAGGSGNCPESINFCIKSIGSFGGTRRAIEIKY
ncbi:MAG: hypothetical protein PHW72_01020 [Candidatus Pacebacteria bacterium]|nr:hypothetical protein [Candidatus Paceibacterota bacterium]